MINLLKCFQDIINGRSRRSFALDELDVKLAGHLRKRGGTFVEAGANDGLAYSNTLYFEKYLKWTGLLVEPLPHLALQCRNNRPNCSVKNAALVPFGFQDREIEMWACGLMSFVEGSFKTDEEAQTHLDNSQKVLQPVPERIQVPALPLSNILDEYGLRSIDLLSLDVEGFEAAALEGVDFERHAIEFILVEARYRADVERVLLPRYDLVEELTPRDLLFRKKTVSVR